MDNVRLEVNQPRIEIRQLNQYKLLDSAYTTKSRPLMISFFNGWRKSTEQGQDPLNKNSMYRNTITNILISFYRPDTIGLKDYNENIYEKKMERMFYGTDAEFIKKFNMDDFVGNSEYFVVQNSVVFSIFPDTLFLVTDFTNSNDRRLTETKTDSIFALNYSQSPIYSKILLYNKMYEEILNEYMNAANEDSLKNTYKEIETRTKSRLDAIHEFITITKEYWRNEWHIITLPHVYRINLNQSLNRAHIEFRATYNSGGSADMELTENEWKVTKFRPGTWMQ